ncbi:MULTISPECIES: NADP-dependent oxidoreductase [Pseudomonas]|jgi:NADPH:quinone reductase-like Zn-dependent oxidoreductase|uniref:Zinc-binding dehydrogenase n=1 Tax=Pseudomonas lactis TaxID=1615674 RepID=A0ABS9FYT6_9PSED|nr:MULTISPECIES: NADP-dependent oxidoreductase [Pseudomonas]MBI6974478.1 NADP-dependent oxidoreductase [Pseudomonas lactis]MCA4964247.1 NADP-dependent oxidoreductase [Pseudomonas sp. Y24-6]MCF4974851.1 zinc-binding dehydrogenase [Pseudomonas lactis]MCF5004581.1 zinc-binding dehydrogenase [Pseudomonas lactis]MCF5009806.1 zinc-binding dehydrogenase [Pseudomonas lactis]
MKAFFIERYGKSGGRIGELPDPVVGTNDVLVQIKATSVNLLDSKIRTGEFKQILPYKFPLILGNDLAGVVVRVGPGVRQFKAGDEVYARPPQNRIGTFAEFISVNQKSLALKPRNVSMEQAASLPLVALTAWQVLVECAHLKKGQKVLIHAGSGGVGSIAIQLAKHLGAFVATTTSTSNVEWVKALGADIVIDYKKQNFETVLDGYDVVLNSLNADTLKKSLQCLKPGGQLISISGPPTPEFGEAQGLSWAVKPILRLLSLGIRRASRKTGVKYSFVFMRSDGAQLSEITALVESGAIKPIIDKVYPFASTADALTYLEQGRSKGKVVITVA